ncbi:MAG: leucine-rich repeat protein [Muribaculaceae bacterium]|nr:leucine-rich repeat protein [Muribaculaceae bacterium]
MFYECTGLISITIPNSVTSIAGQTFSYCTGLTNVILGSAVTSIGPCAFMGCYGLTSIIIPNSVTSIESRAFYDCSGLTNIIIPSSVTAIRSYAFIACPSLSYVIMMNSTPPSGSQQMFQEGQLIYVPNESNYESAFYWRTYNIQGFYSIEPQITRATILSNNQNLFTLKQAALKDADGQVLKTFAPMGNKLAITDMFPNSNNYTTVNVDINIEQIEIDDIINTQNLSFTHFSSSLTTQTTLTPTFTVNRDEGFTLDACGVESSTDIYYGSIKETTDDSYTIECKIIGLTPNSSYSLRPWVQYRGVKYYGYYSTFNTAAIEVNNDITVSPTSVYLKGNYSSLGDAIVTNAYFTFNGEKDETLYKTGLNPNTSYYYNYTIETTSGNQVTSNYFYTPSLSMEAQPVRMLTNTTVMFEAQTNMIDDETMVGFEWRRYDAPDEMPSTKVYSPVFGGKIAGTLKNLAENVYYKYRPFYTSNSGKSYYGNWVAFLTADAGVEYEPMVYTYNSPVVTQAEATLQGVALRGSDDITEQGFEYWKSGNGNVTKVTAIGERMSKKVSGLQSGTKYIFRAFLTAGGETYYGNEVEFVTISNSLDVNLDGEINIADINAVIDIILTDKPGLSGDVNGDDEVNIADINTIIDAILSN